MQKTPKNAKIAQNCKKNAQKWQKLKKYKNENLPVVTPHDVYRPKKIPKRANTVRLSENDTQECPKRPKNAKNAIIFQALSRFF